MVLPSDVQDSDSGMLSGKGKRGLPIAHKLSLLVVLLVVFITTLVAYFTIREFRGHIVEEELRLLSSNSHAASQQIEASLKSLSDRTSYLANTPPVPGILRASAMAGIDPLDKSSIEQWYRRLTSLSVSMLRVNRYTRSITLYRYDGSGEVLVNVSRDGGEIHTGNESAALDEASERYFQSLKQEPAGTVIFSGIEHLGGALEDGGGSVPAIRASLVIRDHTNRPFALLSFLQDMSAAFQKAASDSISGQNNRFYLANQQGEYLFHPLQPDDERSSEPLRLQDDFTGLAADIDRIAENAFVQFYGHAEQQVALGLRGVPLNSDNSRYLIVAIQRNMENVTALTENAVWQVIMAASVIMALSLVLGLWFARSIAQPLRQLSEAADKFANGDQSLFLPNKVTGEMGRLVNSFNTMLNRIRENTVLMKSEVKFRQQAEFRMQQNVLMLEQFNDITADHEVAFEEKCRQLLRLGMRSLDVSMGIIVQRESTGQVVNRFHVGDGISSYPYVLETCERIVQTRRPIVSNEIGAISGEIMESSGPAGSASNDGCFAGAPIISSKSIKGVVAFAALQSKDELFVTDATSFLQLVSEWLSGELERLEGVSALEETEYQQRVILDNMFDGLITINPEGTIESFNKMACSMFGYQPEEVVGRNIKMLMPEPYHSEHDGYLKNYMGGGEAKIIGQGREVVAQRKDGSVFPVDLAVTEVKIGDLQRFVGTLRDISERKAHEEKQRLQGAALESAANAIVITDVEGKIVWVNQAFTRFTGYEKERVLGVNPRILKSGKQDRTFYKSMWDCILSGQVWHGELLNRRKDGSEYPEEQTITPVADESGKITHFVAIKQDITERKKVETMKSEFVSTVSHELRTPLTSIRGSLGLLMGGGMGELSAQAKSLVEIACNNSERLVRLINDILDMEKIESGKMAFSLRPIELGPVIREVISANQGYAEQYQVKIVEQNSYPGVRVLADPDRLSQVMTNLISNAAKFSPEQSEITVIVLRQGEGVRISVVDQGPGIPKEFQPRIFSKFSQADASNTRQKGGTGLGLSISRAIIEKLGGSISFDTESDKGTEFHVDLPIWKVTEQLITSDDGNRPQVLICEDDPDVAVLLQMMMEKQGIGSDVAYSAEEAWQQLGQQEYSAMTLDLMLPGQDGLSFLHQLRGEERTRDLPIIVISAVADREKENLEGDVLAVVDWIEKPIPEERLAESITRALKTVESERASVLHVEDDKDIAIVVSTMTKDIAEVTLAGTLAEAEEQLSENEFDLVILDVGLPDGSGLSLVPQLTDCAHPVPVIIFSAHDLDKAVTDGVSAALVKSKTNNQQIMAVIKEMIGKQIKDKKKMEKEHPLCTD